MSNITFAQFTCNESNAFSQRINPSKKKKIIVLGSGPNRIGQGLNLIIAVFMAYSP
jgi:hypothetical protein